MIICGHKAGSKARYKIHSIHTYAPVRASGVYVSLFCNDIRTLKETNGGKTIMAELTLSDHAEAWARSHGYIIPDRNTQEWGAMYRDWIGFAFQDF